MIKSFRHKNLHRFYARGSRKGLNAEHVTRIRDILARLDASATIDGMNVPSLRLHRLKGDRKGQWAVTVRANWRITFRFESGNAFDVDLLDYHLEGKIMNMFKPPHPGGSIKEEFDYLGLSVAAAAKALGVTRQQLYRVIKGDSGISPEMALRLEAVIGSTADTWLRMQSAHDIAQVRGRAGQITKGLKRVPEPSEPVPEQSSLG